MAKSFLQRVNWRAFGVVMAASITLLFFQNCGKTGTDEDELASLTADTPEVKKYKAAGFPYDVNINQVAYMTCPAAANSKAYGDDLDNPFFTFRVGAFDNRTLANRFPQAFNPEAAVLTDPERTRRLVAGIGLDKDFVSNIRTSFSQRLNANPKKEEEQRLLRDALVNSPYKFQLSSGFVLRKRIDDIGFAWSQDHAKPILAPLATANVANQIVATTDLGANNDREKLFELTGVQADQKAFVTSLGIPKSEADRDRLRQNLIQYEFVVGYSKPEFLNDVFMLESPTGDNNDGFFGKVYRFTTSNQWAGKVDRTPTSGGLVTTANNSSIYSEFLSGVEEIEYTSTGAERNITTTEQQKWSCFSLMVIREVDRRDSVASTSGNRVIDPGDYEDSVASGRRICSLWGPTPEACATKLKFYNYRPTPTSPLIPGAKAACPIQEVGSPTRFGSLNSQMNNGSEMMRLEIARRFLPAEFWDINTNPEYMCAVPKPAASNFGNCYQSGDRDGSKYIMYTQTGEELGRAVTCGINQFTGELQKECPAFVSICYRTY